LNTSESFKSFLPFQPSNFKADPSYGGQKVQTVLKDGAASAYARGHGGNKPTFGLTLSNRALVTRERRRRN
jgi:hypothetical protein